MRGIYDRLFSERAGRERGDQFDLAGPDEDDDQASLPQILNPAQYAPELAGMQFNKNAYELVKQLLGPEAMPQGAHLIFKPARIGAETPWHQDEAYWDAGLEYNALSVWMPLQEATIENGCMQFIPGSHRLEVQPHHPINHDPRIHGLEADELDTSTAVACPLPPGGATFHTNRTFHYTAANRTDVPRRAYIMMFGTRPKKRTEPRRFPWVDARTTPRLARAAKAGIANSEPHPRR